jgi:tRNA-specific 2-thiouridylase
MGGLKNKVFVAVSGGVDSSTAAAILLERGYDVSGVFMLTCDASRAAEAKARKVAETLGIKLHILDMRKDFRQVLEYFCSEYRQGRTPNPCVFCNRMIKFGRLWRFAKDQGAEYFSTGHYVRIDKASDGFGLYEAPTEKDQSYALAMIDRKILPHLIFPMGDYTKEQTRQLARQFGLDTAEHKESQEICFIPDDDYITVLEKLAPELVKDGDIIDTSGRVLGAHHGIHRYTIGQRRGLRVAMGKPYYVVRIDAGTNTVTLGPRQEAMHKKLFAAGVNWLTDPPDGPLRAKVKIRYNDKGSDGTVRIRGEQIEVDFDQAVSAITPGQLAVFYAEQDNGWRIVGGAWIEQWSD